MEELNYEKSKNYWSNVSPSVDSMLGGYSCLTSMDIRDSNIFLKHLFRMKNGPSNVRVLDCGAGIGRITENLLCKHFKYADLLEQDEKFLKTAKQKLQGTNVDNFYCCGLQEFMPINYQQYDVIWIQWVLGYITDDDLVKFLKRCCKLLSKNGVIVVKENISQLEEGDLDSQDSSITRSFLKFCQIFEQANLICTAKKTQQNFPSELYQVEMFALKPANSE
ncbi:S-adenosyl-L-methionine-dependent methyltransferase,Alpha-N-methyltransferase NTM1 [Cinara cedri]|uniref:Alpha N-terminal protein methyltransferase 1 n=1 Tax=Cinara cedri TaxID=506608 RepID=A0A5E4LY20_9HEMI|nr:S-adenosyl-L-methionine-dependent methyltransferase,Alpha-N-methyltransferase NTM1 [Cinara cedri]